MYIKKVVLRNIRCLEEQVIDFEQKGTSIVISGDNGEGKSTILRSIAMGLMDETSASALLRELPGDFVKKGNKKGYINIYLVDYGNEYEIQTEIRVLEVFEKVEQKLFKYINGKKIEIKKVDDFPWDKIFVCGYGAGVRTDGTLDYQHYTNVDAVYPLFKYDVSLQNPELAIRRIVDSAWDKGKDKKESNLFATETENFLMQLLSELLNLKQSERVKLSYKGIEVSTKKWGKIELGSMGDGYIATTTWIMDLLSWWMLYLELIPRKNIYDNRVIKGIVFIDELEQHLHPRWQKVAIRTLREKFPKIQFIISTHSPLVISGAEDIIVYAPKNGKFIPIEAEGWLAEDVFREIMGIETSRPIFIQTKLNRYKSLYEKKFNTSLGRKEQLEMRSIKKSLQKYGFPQTDPLVLSAELKALLSNPKK